MKDWRKYDQCEKCWKRFFGKEKRRGIPQEFEVYFQALVFGNKRS